MTRALRMWWMFVAVGAVASLAALGRARVAASSPRVPPAALERALVAEDWPRVDAEAAAWMQAGGFSAEGAALRGYAALERGDAEAAVRHFLRAQAGTQAPEAAAWARSLARRYPDRAGARLVAADAAMRQGDRRAALAHLDVAVGMRPDMAAARIARATAYVALGETARALQDTERLAEDGAVVPEALVIRGLAHLEEKRQRQALAELDRAISIEPNHAVAYNTRGLAHAQRGEWVTAARDFEAAFRVAPELTAARQNWRLARRAARDPGAVVSGDWRNRKLTVLVTDFGINQWSAEMRLGDDFSRAKTPSVIPDLRRPSQMLVPMPSDRDFPKTPAARDELRLNIANTMIRWIERGRLEVCEARIVQNVNSKGYFDPGRQARVKEFGRLTYEALDLVKQHFSGRGAQVEMPAIVGSNGAFLLTETVPRLRANPIDRAVLVDGRAYASATRATYTRLEGQLTAINTRGDAPSLPDMIANHDALKRLKRDLPQLRVLLTDAGGPNIPLTQHLAAMRPDVRLQVREFDGQGYTKPVSTSGPELLSTWLRPREGDPAMAVRPSALARDPGGVRLGPVVVERGAGGHVAFRAGDQEGGDLSLVATLFPVSSGARP